MPSGSIPPRKPTNIDAQRILAIMDRLKCFSSSVKISYIRKCSLLDLVCQRFSRSGSRRVREALDRVTADDMFQELLR